MVQALRADNKEVPGYLNGLALTYDNPNIKEVAFAMFCYWTGEMELGAIRGVVNTEAGHYSGREVTRVWYDSKALPLENLIQRAQEVKCADAVYVPANQSVPTQSRLKIQTFKESGYHKASKSDQKKQIQGFNFKGVSLSPYQLTKFNSFYRRDRNRAASFLSSNQKKVLFP